MHLCEQKENIWVHSSIKMGHHEDRTGCSQSKLRTASWKVFKEMCGTYFDQLRPCWVNCCTISLKIYSVSILDTSLCLRADTKRTRNVLCLERGWIMHVWYTWHTFAELWFKTLSLLSCLALLLLLYIVQNAHKHHLPLVPLKVDCHTSKACVKPAMQLKMTLNF